MEERHEYVDLALGSNIGTDLEKRQYDHIV